MIEENRKELTSLFKKFLKIFVEEYTDYLTKDELEVLRDINLEKIIKIEKINNPIGVIYFNQILLSDNIEEEINKLTSSNRNKVINNRFHNNTNYKNYLKSISNLNYTSQDYYKDHLMYLLFKLVIQNDSGLVNGLINREVSRLRNKYRFNQVNLYKREEVIANKMIDEIGLEAGKHLIFLDTASSYKYLNDTLGNKYAEYFNTLNNLVNNEYLKFREKELDEDSSLLNYAENYDSLLYGDCYNYQLDFELENHSL